MKEPNRGNSLGGNGTSSGGAEDFRLLLTVIAGIALGVAATAIPGLIEGTLSSWVFAAKLIMWVTGVAAVILFYLAVLFGSKLYLTRVDVVATTSLALVFLGQAGMFAVLGMDADQLGPRWFVMFALYNVFAGLETEHARRIIVRHAVDRFDSKVVRIFARSLAEAVALVFVTAIGSLLFVVIWSDAPPLAWFVAAGIALASVIFANIQQHQVRTKLAASGVW